MDMSRFANSPVGQLVETTITHDNHSLEVQAFVPDPLPVRLSLQSSTWKTVVETGLVLGELAGMTRQGEEDPTLLAGLTVRREAISTSALEGTYAEMDDVLIGEVSPQGRRSTAVQEVLNYMDASDAGARRLKKLPVSKRLACELHQILVADTPSEDYQAGKIRKTHVVIGPKRDTFIETMERAHFMPSPPGTLLNDGLNAWEAWNHEAGSIPELVRIALSHYQFETLHPFTDGNGRIGRLLAVLQLIEAGILDDAVINLSPYLETRRDQYVELLQQVSAEGAWDPWVSFFCETLAAQATDTISRFRRFLEWRADTLSDLHDKRIRGVAIRVVQDLLARPVLTARRVKTVYGVASNTAYHALDVLEQHGILRRSPTSDAKVYIAPDVYDMLR